MTSILIRTTYVFSDQETPDYIIRTRDEIPDIEGVGAYAGSCNNPTISECIDSLLNDIEKKYLDPAMIDWSNVELTSEQTARIERLHHRYDEILSALHAISETGRHQSGDGECFEDYPECGIELKYATPDDVTNWLPIID